MYTLKKAYTSALIPLLYFLFIARILEFSDLTEVPAFFVRSLWWAHFLIYGEITVAKEYENKYFPLKYFTEVEIEKVSPEEKEKRRRRALVYDIKDIIKKGDTLTDEELECEINDALRLYFINPEDTF